jgi:LCP family protein required for cell wall assembly
MRVWRSRSAADPLPSDVQTAYPLLGALEPPRRRRFWWRALLGCLVVLLAAGGASAVFVLEQVHTVVADLSVNRALKVDSRVLAPTDFGQPETLLLIGDDTRSVYRYYRGYVPNLANEMLLVRIDPSKPWISLMSLPRELWVPITEPDGITYTNRLNSAYTYGTTTLLRTIKQITGLSVSHVIATTFTQFERAINTLGCVYDTIDERYYHNNADGGAQYQNIDLLPGYQCLNGNEAEEFVSYRHTDTSQVRDARDQSFLLAVKQEYGPRLSGNIGRFEQIFGQTVQTDSGLRSSGEILNLANLLISVQALRVRQVPFQVSPCTVTCPPADLTATSGQIADSVHNFLFGGSVVPARQVAAISHRVSHRAALAGLPLTAVPAATVAAERALAGHLPFLAEFPRVQDRAGAAIPVTPRCTQLAQACLRSYLIHAPDGTAYPIYVEAFAAGGLGQFYDVQGTSWTHVPLLDNPNQTIRVGAQTYELFYQGSHLGTVAWRHGSAVYWVHNTLTNGISNGELLAIAEQTAPVTSVPGIVTTRHLRIHALSVPPRHVPVATTPLRVRIGDLGGLIALVFFPLGLAGVILARRRVRDLRDRLQTATARRAVLEARLARAAPGNAPRGAPGGSRPGGSPPGPGTPDAGTAKPSSSEDGPDPVDGGDRRALVGS